MLTIRNNHWREREIFFVTIYDSNEQNSQNNKTHEITLLEKNDDLYIGPEEDEP